MYETLDLEDLLTERGIVSDALMPKRQNDNEVILNADPDNPAPFPAYLPLHIFDNTEHDCRTPQEWIELGKDNGARKPIPGFALLPQEDVDVLCKFRTLC